MEALGEAASWISNCAAGSPWLPVRAAASDLATAKAFALEGCRIMLSARSTEQLRETETALRATGAEVAAHAADVANPDGAARLIEATVAAYGGGIDTMINNVGGGGGGARVADSSDDDWRAALE